MRGRTAWLSALGMGLVAAGAASAASPDGTTALRVEQVRHDPMVLSDVDAAPVEISFRLIQPARVWIHLYDVRDLEIRTLHPEGLLPAGDHSVEWDARDQKGRPVPPEAYLYTIELEGADKERQTWDLSDLTGGDLLAVRNLKWNAKTRMLSYRLPGPSRVRLRVGLENHGPMLATPIDWVARGSGSHEEPWDGRDRSRVLDFSTHAGLEFRIDVFALPRNAIVVGPAAPRPVVIEDLSSKASRRPRSEIKGPRRVFDPAAQPFAERRDFEVEIRFPGDLRRSADGAVQVDGPVAVEVSVADAEMASIIASRCEVAFYVDGLFLFEAESGFLPTTWNWDPASLAPGVHYLTVNIIGYEGYSGTGTHKVVVLPARSSEAGRRQVLQE